MINLFKNWFGSTHQTEVELLRNAHKTAVDRLHDVYSGMLRDKDHLLEKISNDFLRCKAELDKMKQYRRAVRKSKQKDVLGEFVCPAKFLNANGQPDMQLLLKAYFDLETYLSSTRNTTLITEEQP